MFSFFICLSDG